MKLLFSMLFGFVFPLHAEYRVFELIIEEFPSTDIQDSLLNNQLGSAQSGNEVEQTQPPKQRTVLSTLDPLQYPSYYPLKANEKISYINTWRCYGNTNQFKKYCPNPKLK